MLGARRGGAKEYKTESRLLSYSPCLELSCWSSLRELHFKVQDSDSELTIFNSPHLWYMLAKMVGTCSFVNNHCQPVLYNVHRLLRVLCSASCRDNRGASVVVETPCLGLFCLLSAETHAELIITIQCTTQ